MRETKYLDIFGLVVATSPFRRLVYRDDGPCRMAAEGEDDIYVLPLGFALRVGCETEEEREACGISNRS